MTGRVSSFIRQRCVGGMSMCPLPRVADHRTLKAHTVKETSTEFCLVSRRDPHRPNPIIFIPYRSPRFCGMWMEHLIVERNGCASLCGRLPSCFDGPVISISGQADCVLSCVGSSVLTSLICTQ